MTENTALVARIAAALGSPNENPSPEDVEGFRLLIREITDQVFPDIDVMIAMDGHRIMHVFYEDRMNITETNEVETLKSIHACEGEAAMMISTASNMMQKCMRHIRNRMEKLTQ